MKITEEMGIHKEWYAEAKSQTLDTLPKFIEKLLSYEHDYGTICHALAAGGIATMWAMESSPQGGITGFQAGAVMWEIIRHWTYESNKCGMRLIDYDKLLYPQYWDHFDKTISKETWDKVQDSARSELADADNMSACREVKDHWRDISVGKLPFGFIIKD